MIPLPTNFLGLYWSLVLVNVNTALFETVFLDLPVYNVGYVQFPREKSSSHLDPPSTASGRNLV